MLSSIMPWLIMAGSVAFAAAFAFFGGRNREKIDASERNLDAAKRAKDTRHEIETDDDQRIIDILTGKLHNKR